MLARSLSIDFAGLIRAGDLVVCGQATAEPLTLTQELVEQAADLPPFRLMVGPVFSDTFARGATIAHSVPILPPGDIVPMSCWCNLPNLPMVG